MTKLIQTNWIAGLASIIPGLGIFYLGKKRLGLGISLTIGLSLALFWFIPNYLTWFIFGIAYFAQMAYAVGLATIQTTKTKITPNSNLSHPLPIKFTNKGTIAVEVKKSLSTILGSDEKLKAVVIGLRDATQYMFVGITDEHLILSHCSHDGNPSPPYRVLKDDVSWVHVKNGERNFLLTIKYEDGKKLELHLLGKLREQGKLIMDEFPGTWENENLKDSLSSFFKETNKFQTNIYYIICFAFMIAMVFLTDGLEQTSKGLAFYLPLSIILFLMGWPSFIAYIRRLKNEPGITTINAIATLSMGVVLFLWWMSLQIIGVFSMALVRTLQNTG